jgi:ferrous iron transport protein B
MNSTPMIALAGSPNCGKTALFNALTGGRQKVGNYAGVTVERKEGTARSTTGFEIQVLDLPGAYSLDARSVDESVTRDILMGKNQDFSQAPDALIAVADATNLERSLSLVLELQIFGVPTVLALNMMDLAEKRGLKLDLDILARELGVPVVATVAVKNSGIPELMTRVESLLAQESKPRPALVWKEPTIGQIHARFKEVDRILSLATRSPIQVNHWTDRIDRIVLHPIWGSLVLFVVLALVFQAVFSWAGPPADAIEALISVASAWVTQMMPEGMLRDLLVDGILAGVGGVLVFLPQILILFGFIIALEDSGYMARAAFLMDRVMSRAGLNGRAFIPLLSSHACAIPGIMATRTISNRRDRLATILAAPITTCSARLPVYTLLISAFFSPDAKVLGWFGVQGAVMLALYVAGIVFALLTAWLLKLTVLRGPKPELLMEMPTYKWPSMRNLGIGLTERAVIFLKRAGTVILSLTVVLWALSSFPKAPEGATEPAIYYSYAGKLGHAIEPVIRPLGFDWRIGVALVPGFAAREVMVSALATVYAVEGNDDDAKAEALSGLLAKNWSLATAVSLLVWYIFALQCLSTVAVIRRETNSWSWPAFAMIYLTGLGYLASFVTYQVLS